MLPHNDEFVGNGFEPVTLGVLRGCLCMVLWFDYSIVIWMMKDYDVHESWSKVASYSGEQRLSWNHLIWSSAGHEDDDYNNIMLSSSERLGLFRAKDGMMEEHHSLKHCSCFDEDEDFTFQVTHHVESLVSPTY
ncbi:hypothetical protein LIER_21436 [Lithospermum erythrorhizon]|uniref:F-box protein n=1 Tax=Lithospermum erythrorhizon TaxID=34254 RepID=A0AAV3QQ75_LITER